MSDKEYNEKDIMIIHRNYCIGILILLSVALFTKVGVGNDKLDDIISFGATLTGLILSVIAIIMTIIGETKTDNTKDTLVRVSNNIKKIVDTDLKKSSDTIIKTTDKLNNVNSVLIKVDDGVESTNTVLEEVKVNNDEMKQLLGNLNEKYNLMNERMESIHGFYKQIYDKINEDNEQEIEKTNEEKNYNDIQDYNGIEKAYCDSNIQNTTHNIVVKRGEIYYADLSPVIGSEQGGIRPVVIIQNDVGNRYSPTVIITAITYQINKARLPIHAELSSEQYSFNRDSVVLAEHIRTLDKRRLKDKIGQLTEKDMKKVDRALAISLSLK